MSQSIPSTIRVLMIEDNDVDAMFVSRLLSSRAEDVFVVDHVHCLSEAIEKMEANDYDVALSDLALSDATGLEAFEKLRALDARLPVVMLTGLNDEKLGLTAVESGAQDFIAKEHVSGQMLYRVLRYAIARQLKVMGIQAAADTDPLTGLPNRRYLQAKYAEIIGNAEKLGEPISLAIVDVDHFKGINDKYGHFVGDVVLKRIATVFVAELGERVRAMRIGGEEFAILMPGYDIEQACGVIDSLLRTLESSSIELDDRSIVVTASAGVLELDYCDPWDKAFIAADAALYEAKSLGRNRYQRRDHVKSSAR